MLEVKPHDRGSILFVRAQPGARTNAVAGERSGALRVAVAAAPERGKANEAIAAVLAEALGCRKSQITLLSGQTARDKRFLVENLTPAEVVTRLASLIQAG